MIEVRQQNFIEKSELHKVEIAFIVGKIKFVEAKILGSITKSKQSEIRKTKYLNFIKVVAG